LAVLVGEINLHAQVVQRTSHPRPPPQHTPGPRATRRRAPKPHRAHGDPRAAVVAARVPSGQQLGCLCSQQLLRRRRSFTRSRRRRFGRTARAKRA
jgi:hypothetical protein